MFPFIDTAPRAARPVVVLGLIAANVFIFLWMQSLPPRMLHPGGLLGIPASSGSCVFMSYAKLQ